MSLLIDDNLEYLSYIAMDINVKLTFYTATIFRSFIAMQNLFIFC